MKAPEKVSIDGPPGWCWETPSIEWLEHQHLTLGKPSRQIAKEVGCSGWKVKQWIRDAGWREARQVSEDPLAPVKVGQGCGTRFKGITRKWLYGEYVTKDKSAKQIADEIDTTHHTVWKWLLKHEIPTRTREEMNARHAVYMSGAGSPSWKGGVSRNYQAGLIKDSGEEKVCEWCGDDENVHVHHKDHNTQNGSLENLTYLCYHCNLLEAHAWNLEQKGRATVQMEDNKLTICFRRQ